MNFSAFDHMSDTLAFPLLLELYGQFSEESARLNAVHGPKDALYNCIAQKNETKATILNLYKRRNEV